MRRTTPRYLTPKQLAYQLDVHPNTVLNWCNSGRVPAYRVGSRWRIESQTDYLSQFSNLD